MKTKLGILDLDRQEIFYKVSKDFKIIPDCEDLDREVKCLEQYKDKYKN